MLSQEIIKLLQEKKAEDIVALDISEQTVMTDYFIICTGRSTTQVRALADHVTDSIKQKQNILPKGVEGLSESKWILLDFGDAIVHIFRNEEREYYNLERLWVDAKRIEVKEDDNESV